jgi:putative flippase GtrA
MSDRWGRIGRFGLVGFANTAVDFGILFSLTALGVQVFVANVVSTSVALGLSFVLNRNFTFRSDGHRGRQVVLFFVVTLVGLWGLQPVVIFAVQSLLPGADGFTLLVGKACATAVSLVWNYMLYAKVVFPRPRPS